MTLFPMSRACNQADNMIVYSRNSNKGKLWTKKRKLSFTMADDITKIKDTIFTPNVFTEGCGKMRTAQYQTIITFIIKMGIRTTTVLRIWNAFIKQNTTRCISQLCAKWKLCREKTRGIRLMSGIGLMSAERSKELPLKRDGLKESRLRGSV